MARRSPAKKKKPQAISSNQPNEENSESGIPAQSTNVFGSSAPALSSTSLPHLAPSSETEEPWSPTRGGGLRSPSRSQANQVSSLQAENASLETELWAARSDLQKIQDERKADEEMISRLTGERNRLRGDADTNTTEIEYLKSREQELLLSVKQLEEAKLIDRKNQSSQRNSHDQYIESLLSQIAELQSSNERQRNAERLAQQKVKELQESLSASTSGIDESFLSSFGEGDSTSDLNLDPNNASSHSISSDLLNNSSRNARQNRTMRNANLHLRKELAASRQKITELMASIARSNAPEDNSFHFGESPIKIVSAPSTSSSVEHPHGTSSDNGFEHHHDDDSTEVNIPEISASDGVPLSEEYAPDNEVPTALHDQARVWNHTLVPTSEYEYLSQRGQEPLAEELEVDDLRRIAGRLDYTLISAEELNHVHELIHGKRSVNAGGNSHVLQDLLQRRTLELAADRSTNRTRSNTPSHSIPSSPKRRTDTSHISYAHEDGNSTDSVYSTAESGSSATDVTLTELRRRAYNPTPSEIASQAASQGLAVLPLKKFDEMKAEQIAQKAEMEKRHSAAEIAQLADDVGCKLIPNNPSPDELQGILGDDIVFVYREAFEAYENPGPATLTRLAKHHGLVVMPESEASDLRANKLSNRVTSRSSDSSYATAPDNQGGVDGTDHTPDVSLLALDGTPTSVSQQPPSEHSSASPSKDISVEHLREAASAHGLVLLSASNYKSMLGAKSPEGKYTNLPVSERARFMQELLDSQRQSGGGSPSRSRNSPVHSSLGSVEDRMRRMGYILVEQDEYQKLKEINRVYEPTKADIVKSAKEFGLATMPLDEFRKLRETRWRNNNNPSESSSPRVSPSKTKTDLFDSSGDNSEFKTVPAIYLQSLRQIVEHPQPENIENLARKANINLSQIISREELKSEAHEIGIEGLFSSDEILAVSRNISDSKYQSDENVISRAKELGLVEPLSDSEILSRARTHGLVDPLSKDQIIVEAKKYGLTEPLSDHEIKLKALALGLVNPLTDNEILDKAKTMGLVSKPSSEDILAHAKSLGLIEPLSDDEIKRQAKKLGLIDPLSNNEILYKGKQLGLIDPNSRIDLIPHAKNHGLIEPLSDDEIKRQAKKLGLIDPLSDNEILTKGKQLGLIDPNSRIDLIPHAKKLGLVESLTREDIITQGKSYGLVDPISDNEILTKGKQLGLIDPNSRIDLVSHAKKLGLVEPPTRENIITQGKNYGLVDPISDNEILTKGKQLGLIDPNSRIDLVSHAKRLGMISPPTNEDILKKSKALGLVEPLSDEDIVDKAQKLGLVKPYSKDEVIIKAKEFGLIEPPSDKAIISKSKSLGLVEVPSTDQIISEAKNLGLAKPLSNEQIVAKAKKLGLRESPSDKEILSHAEKLGYAKPLTNDEILSRAKKQGLVVPPSDAQITERAHKLGLSKPPTDSKILNRAKSLGLVERASDQDTLARGKSLGLTEPLTDDQVISKAKLLGLRYPLSDEAIITRAETLGLRHPPTQAQIISEAKKLGLTERLNKDSILSKAKSLGLVEPPSNEEILAKARSQGLSEPLPKELILSKAKTLGLVEPLSDSDIITKAKSLGLSEPLSKDAIAFKAKSMGLTKPLSKEEILSEAKRLGLTEPLNSAEIISRAKDYGLHEKSSSENIPHPSEPDLQVDPSNKAVSQPDEGDNDGSKVVPGQNDTQAEHDSSEVSALTAEKNADSFILSDEPARNELHNAVMQKPTSSAVASMYRRKLGPSSQNMSSRSRSRSPVKSVASPIKNPGSYKQSPVKRTTVPTLSSSRSIDNFKSATSPTKARIPRSQTTRTLDPHRNMHSDVRGRNDSVSTGEYEDYALPLPNASSFRGFASYRRQRSNSNTSRGTQSSWSISTLLSGDDQERLISQIMVGENLYKYYHGIQIENITGGRHKRYFWFRPETKTLFWHSEGQALFSTGLAKHITVTGVEEIADTNQLPVPLYQRSLVIKGKERDVMVTCTSRTRHYVWLSSLRYALEPKS